MDLPLNYWPDVIVGLWICLLGVPAFFTALYLTFMGAWLTLAVIIVAVFVGILYTIIHVHVYTVHMYIHVHCI